jgi:hypothetical protein
VHLGRNSPTFQRKADGHSLQSNRSKNPISNSYVHSVHWGVNMSLPCYRYQVHLYWRGSLLVHYVQMIRLCRKRKIIEEYLFWNKITCIYIYRKRGRLGFAHVNLKLLQSKNPVKSKTVISNTNIKQRCTITNYLTNSMHLNLGVCMEIPRLQ